jgi:S-DNA-T family DNA segregation ATPase FtsK/SpoIIIE
VDELELEPEDDAADEPDLPAPVVSRPVASAPAAKPKPVLRAVTPAARPARKESDGFELPPLELLAEPRQRRPATIDPVTLEQNAGTLEGILEDFGVRGEIIDVKPGPVVTLYELEPAPGSNRHASSVWRTTSPAP